MEVLYLLVPLSLVLAGVVVWALLWAVRSGQFEDLEGAAHRILLDDEDRPVEEREGAGGEPWRHDAPKARRRDRCRSTAGEKTDRG